MNKIIKNIRQVMQSNKTFSMICIYLVLFLIIGFIFQCLTTPSNSDVKAVYEQHLRISRDLSEVERYNNASMETVHNSISNQDERLITIKGNHFQTIARYDHTGKLLSIEQYNTVPFYPYINWIFGIALSGVLGTLIILYLKRKDFFMPTYEFN